MIGKAQDGGKVKFRITKVRLDRGGYDGNGRYWGGGEPLWRVDADHDGKGDTVLPADTLHLRARDKTKPPPGEKYHPECAPSVRA